MLARQDFSPAGRSKTIDVDCVKGEHYGDKSDFAGREG